VVQSICILLFLGIILAIGIWFVPWVDRRRVCRMIEQAGGTIVGVRRIRPLLRSLLSERNTTFWEIRYRASDGTIRIAECFASFLRCKVYSDKPEDRTPYCSDCGYNLTGNTSGRCPECGSRIR